MNKILQKLIILLLICLLLLIFFNIYPYIANVLMFIKNILLPFFIAFVIAYVLQPIVCFIERIVKKRKFAVFLTIFLVVLLLIISFKTTFPFIQKEIVELSGKMPEIISALEDKLNKFSENFSFLPKEYQPNFENLKNLLIKFIEKLDIAKLFNSIVYQLGNIIITPVILIYFMFDYNNIVEKFKNYLVKTERTRFKEYLSKLNEFFSKYIKTTILVMIILIMLSTITFTIIGLDYPFFFGIIIGLTNIIPYIGPYIGGAFPVVYAMTSDINVITVLIAIIIIQLVESSLITPYLHSKNSQTHPILVILSLSLSGALFGVMGLIFAVPILKFVEITIQYYPIENILKHKEIKV